MPRIFEHVGPYKTVAFTTADASAIRLDPIEVAGSQRLGVMGNNPTAGVLLIQMVNEDDFNKAAFVAPTVTAMRAGDWDVAVGAGLQWESDVIGVVYFGCLLVAANGSVRCREQIV